MTILIGLCVLLTVLSIWIELLDFEDRPGFQLITNLGLGGVRGLVDFASYGQQVFLFEGVRALFDGGLFADRLNTSSWVTWGLCILGFDFLYYWAHRASHRSGLLWSIHTVHHQATQFDLTVGLRVSVLNTFANLLFFLPLAALGFPTVVFFGVTLAHFLGMGWLHTRKVPSIPWLEGWLNTPALHWVHHSYDEAHVDRNFGGVLIIWDRVFGTYLAAEPVRAVGVGGQHWAPGVLGSHLLPWVVLKQQLQKERSLKGKLRLLFIG